METKFSCYTKMVGGETFYFVKKFIVFTELENLQPMQEAFGMHANFDKACMLAQLYDEAIKAQLLQEIESGIRPAKVIDIVEAKFNNNRSAFGM